MDGLSVAALLISLAAIALSTYLALKQNLTQRQANTIPALSLLLNEFRSSRFWESYEYVCNELENHQPEGGIAGLPNEARTHVYNVCYLLQHIGDLARLGVVSERGLLSTLRFRVIRVWKAVKPFVVEERVKNASAGPDNFRLLEAFAARAEMIPETSYSEVVQQWRARRLR